MTIPKKFECMGFTVTVTLEKVDSGLDGHFTGNKQKISISPENSVQVQEQTFWHEYIHCALTNLGYEDLNDNEQFVDQMAQCLYQLQKTRVDPK